jgi:hypothetical protein
MERVQLQCVDAHRPNPKQNRHTDDGHNVVVRCLTQIGIPHGCDDRATRIQMIL